MNHVASLKSTLRIKRVKQIVYKLKKRQTSTIKDNLMSYSAIGILLLVSSDILASSNTLLASSYIHGWIMDSYSKEML